MLRGLYTQIGIDTALYNREKSLLITIQTLRFAKVFPPPVEPTACQGQGCLGIVVIGIARTTFIEGHNDICSDDPLDIHDLFRGKQMFGAVDM